MTRDHLRDYLTTATEAALEERVQADLGRRSPYIGAKGSPDGDSPERAYVEAMKAGDAVLRSKTGRVVNTILMTLCSRLCARGAVSSSLLFNLLRLLRSCPFPEARPALAALLAMPAVSLQELLAEEGEDLYAQALLALAVNQPPWGEMDLWYRLLAGENSDYAEIAVAGIRAAAWELSCEALPRIQKRYSEKDWGAIKDVVKYLLYYYPDENWPVCAAPYLDRWTHPELWGLLRSSAERLAQLRENRDRNMQDVVQHLRKPLDSKVPAKGRSDPFQLNSQICRLLKAA